MTSKEVMIQLQQIFNEVFSGQVVDFDEKTAFDEIPEWDSLNHAILFDKVEKHFEIKFDFMDVLDMNNVADIRDGILKKKN